MTALRRAFVAASIVWALMLPLAAFVASRSGSGHAAYAFALAVYAAGSVVCHQLPARSFALWSAKLPVCARCTGIYTGGAVASTLIAGRGAGRDAARMTRTRARSVLAIAAAPTVATLAWEWTTGNTPANAVRALAGLPIGAAVAWVVLGALG